MEPEPEEDEDDDDDDVDLLRDYAPETAYKCQSLDGAHEPDEFALK